MAASQSVSAQWFQKVWNERDHYAIEELLAPEGIVRGLGDPTADVRGPAEYHEYRAAILRAFPDLQVEVVREVSAGDLEAVQFSVAGTHQGEFLGVPPTGRRVAFFGMGMSRVADGMIQESWNVIDFHACIQQLTVPEE